MLTSTTNKVQYSISYPFGSTFPVTFKYWLAAEIHAVLAFPVASGKSDQNLVLNTDFSLSAPGDTGTLTRLSDWDHDAIRLTIYRLLDIDQTTDYRNGEAVDMDLLEQDFDRATARMQQVDERTERTLQGPITDEEPLSEIPEAAVRAGHFLGFDVDGDTMIGDPAGVPVSPWAQTLLDDPDAPAAQTTLGISAYIKTLLDDADAAAARATLGFPSFELETAKLLRGTIADLTLSNNTGDAANDIDIAAGWCLADGATGVITLSGALTKRKDAAWAVGTGNGGMDTGSAPADGFMYLWLIKRADTGVVDALFSISATSPTMPANYTLKRRIGAVRTTSSAILAFEQNGDNFWFKAISVAFNHAVVGSTARQLLTVKVPPNMIGRFNVTAGYGTTGPGFAWAASTGFTDVAPATYYNATLIAYLAGDETMEQEILVDGSSQIAFRVSNATNSLFGCQVLGWIDRRGKNEAV